MTRRRILSILAFTIATSTSAFAELQSADCTRAAKYSESKRGITMLVMQNGRTIFEHYANGGSVDSRWPIFSGTKSFWGIAALTAVRDGLIRLDDRVADTITEWKSPAEAGHKSQITIRQLLNFTDGIEPAPHLHRESIPDRNAMAIRLSTVAAPGSAFTYGPSHLQIFSELLRRPSLKSSRSRQSRTPGRPTRTPSSKNRRRHRTINRTRTTKRQSRPETNSRRQSSQEPKGLPGNLSSGFPTISSGRTSAVNTRFTSAAL